MPCRAPIEAFRPATGGPVRFSPPTNGRAYIRIELPCGYCILCREEQARQQAIRITHEASLWAENSFLTLTYDSKHVPAHNSLDYSHLVKFWKKLRKEIGKLRYYAVGEYGDKTNRPHYHACVFGHAFIADRVIVQTEPYLLWECPWLTKIWGMGRVTIGTLNFQTARYTASYVTKKLRAKQKYVRVDNETGELLELVQPKAFMSRNLAKAWWEQWGRQVIDHDYVIIDGRKQKPPKAYDKWLKEKDEKKMEEIKVNRRKKAKKVTSEQSHARAQNAHARVKQKKKTI